MVELDQNKINLIQYLEKRYKCDIKKSSDYAHFYERWEREGKPLPEKVKVKWKKSETKTLPKLKRGVKLHWED